MWFLTIFISLLFGSLFAFLYGFHRVLWPQKKDKKKGSVFFNKIIDNYHSLEGYPKKESNLFK